MLKEHVSDESLVRHCLATAAVMKETAARLGEDESKWEIIGILHDVDFEEIGGDMDLHGDAGYDILVSKGVSTDTAEIVRRHNYEKFGDFDDPVDIALTASDNISGLVIACALVKGGRISNVTGKTVKKKMKDKSFAAGCNRERILKIESMMDLQDFYEIAVEGVKRSKDELGLL